MIYSNEDYIRIYQNYLYKREPTNSIVVIWVKFFQSDLMVEICCKSLVRAVGKVLFIKFS